MKMEIYPKSIETIRSQYPQLNNEEVYLDLAGSSLCNVESVKRTNNELLNNLLGNPHSISPSSMRTTKIITQTRSKILNLFNASDLDYDIIFTLNATCAIKIISEVLSGERINNINSNSNDKYYNNFVYLQDSHTSLLGLREFFNNFICLSEENFNNWTLNNLDKKFNNNTNETKNIQYGIVSWLGQSNFSGIRYPKNWAKNIRKNHPNFLSLYDASSLICTSSLDLSNYNESPDFIVCSFYKIFGYPDLGALLIRRSDKTYNFFKNRIYFGGGTVEAVISDDKNFIPRKKILHDQLQDGTIPFHSILALSCAIDVHLELYGSFKNISLYTSNLSQNLYNKLYQLKYSNGVHLCEIYCNGNYNNVEKQGPIITFNLRNYDGNSWIGYNEFENLAAVKKINIRTGRLCNIGSTTKWLNLSSIDIKELHAAGAVCGDSHDMTGNGNPTGAIRVSLGAMSTWEDCSKLIDLLIESYLLPTRNFSSNRLSNSELISNLERLTPQFSSSDIMRQYEKNMTIKKKDMIKIEKISIYPIKSCGAYQIPVGIKWKVLPSGFELDRAFCLINLSTGSIISQKRYTNMTLIKPYIMLDENILKLVYKNPQSQISKSIEISLNGVKQKDVELLILKDKLCGYNDNNNEILIYKDKKIIDFFTTVVGIPCSLGRYYNQRLENIKVKSLANESSFLLINENSVNHLYDIGGKELLSHVTSDTFRGNIVVSTLNNTDTDLYINNNTINGNKSLQKKHKMEEYEEDKWKKIIFNHITFQCTGPCKRCTMITVDPNTGKRYQEPYLTLTKTRRVGDNILFGVHLELQSDDDDSLCNNNDLYLQVGDIGYAE